MWTRNTAYNKHSPQAQKRNTKQRNNQNQNANTKAKPENQRKPKHSIYKSKSKTKIQNKNNKIKTPKHTKVAPNAYQTKHVTPPNPQAQKHNNPPAKHINLAKRKLKTKIQTTNKPLGDSKQIKQNHKNKQTNCTKPKHSKSDQAQDINTNATSQTT